MSGYYRDDMGVAQPVLGGDASVLLTQEEAASMHPAERVCKQTAWEKLTWVRENREVVRDDGLIDITGEPKFRWQTWVANMREFRDPFVGSGVIACFVTSHPAAMRMIALRSDNTWSCVELSCTWRGAGWQYDCEFIGAGM